MIPMTDINTRRIVLLGKTGSGKSSLANTIFGDNIFVENNTPNSGTDKCQSETTDVNEHNVYLVDTPGIFDTNPENAKVTPELVKCITECAPGPHAFLLVMKIEKYTVLEMAVVKMILDVFTEEALKYTTVVFTRGDDLPERMRIEEWVSLNQSLNELVQKCGGRCHVIDNKYWKNSKDEYRNNQYQIRELLKTIDQTVENNGGMYYTNDLLKKTDEQIQQEMKRLKATLSGDMSDEDICKKAKENIFKILWSRMKGCKAGIIIGALLGVTVMVPLVLFALPCAISGAVIGVSSMAAGAAAGGEIQHAIKKKIRRRRANETQDTAEQPLLGEREEELERGSEQEEELEDGDEQVEPQRLELETIRKQAEEKMNEWHRKYQEYKKFQ